MIGFNILLATVCGPRQLPSPEGEHVQLQRQVSHRAMQDSQVVLNDDQMLQVNNVRIDIQIFLEEITNRYVLRLDRVGEYFA